MRTLFPILQTCCIGLFLSITLCSPLSASQPKLVIAQGGAAEHLMEHNLPSVTLAAAMGADMIKIDLVLTSDNEVIVFSSPTLDKRTDVAEKFPTRARDDGKFYVLDFTLEEIRQLTLRDPERDLQSDPQLRLTIPTFAEELSLIKRLERALDKNIPLAVEMTQPWFHRKEERDISIATLHILKEYGYGIRNDNIFLLSYDVAELKYLAKSLLPERQMGVRLVQLIDSNDGSEAMTLEWGEWVSYNYDWMFSNTGIRSLATFVAAIGLPKNMLVDSQGQLKLENFVNNAHHLNLQIFTFPVNMEDPARPPFAGNFEGELEHFYFTVGVDGIITDSCGEAVHYLRNRTVPLQVPLQETETRQDALPTPAQEQAPPSALPVEQEAKDPLQLTIPFGYDKKD